MKKKVLVGIVILLSVVAAILLKLIPNNIGDYLFDIFLVTIMFVSALEIYNLKTAVKKNPDRIMTYAYPVFFYLLMLITFRFSLPLYLALLIQLLGLVAWGLISWIVILIKREDKSFIRTLNTTEACLYPSFLLGLLLYINHSSLLSSSTFSFIMIILVFTIPMVTDTCAMFVGCLLHGPKLAPKISPKKTISGAIGGLVGGVLGALAVYGLCRLVPEFAATIDVFGLKLYKFILLGFIGSIIGQAGDLYESYLKRKAGVKDAGTFFPGHGGMLDRVDALAFVSGFMFIFVMVLLA